MLAITIPEADTPVIGYEVNCAGLDKQDLKNGTFLTNGIGVVSLVHHDEVVRTYKTTGIIDYSEGGFELVGKLDESGHIPNILSRETFTLI